jgi:hypothetical protein
MDTPLTLSSDRASLEGITAKIQRADEQIKTLNTEIASFLRDNYRIVGEFDRDARKYRFTAFGETQLPPRFAVVVGEIVHHLRSALDHLVTQLAVFGPGDGDPGTLEFPICLTAEHFKRSVKRGKIKGIPPLAAQTIEACQPYRTSSPPENSELFVLHDLDRIDKHRLLLVVVACVRMTDRLGIDAKKNVTITGMSPPVPAGARPSNDGTEVFHIDFGDEFDPEVKVENNFAFQVAFDHPGVLRNLPVMPTLLQLREAVAMKVIRDSFFPQFPA